MHTQLLAPFKLRAVTNDDKTKAYVYTVNLTLFHDRFPNIPTFGREMFARDVPIRKVETLGKLMNFLWGRMADGVPVNGNQTVQVAGRKRRDDLFMFTELHTKESASVLRDEFNLEQPEETELIELFPGVFSPSDDDIWGNTPETIAWRDARSLKEARKKRNYYLSLWRRAIRQVQADFASARPIIALSPKKKKAAVNETNTRVYAPKRSTKKKSKQGRSVVEEAKRATDKTVNLATLAVTKEEKAAAAKADAEAREARAEALRLAREIGGS
tara:strand:+ start:1129 stop:1944 length:816 start_codon:yes stop_codon:yes gene_type:complete